MRFTVIKRDKDDLIWCPFSQQWVDKRTDSAHFYFVDLAQDAIKNVPTEDKPELLVMHFSEAVGKYFDFEYSTKEEMAEFIRKHI